WWTVGSYINDRGELWVGYVADHTGIDVRTGKLLSFTKTDGTNCFWNRGVGEWKTTGFHWFNTRSRQMLIQGGVRPGCNDGLFFGYGATYSYNHLCACSKWIIGSVAMTAGPMPTPIPDAQRLESMSPLQPGPEDRGGWRDMMGDHARSGRAAGSLPPATATMAWRTPATRTPPAGPIAADWANDATMRAVTAPVLADGMVVVAHGNEHALVAYDAASGRQRWRTQLGGRIDTPPALWRGHAYVGCRDGWVYAIRLSDGRVLWRHLVASDRRQHVNGSHLESLWPVLGSVLVHDGALYACAGRTSQFDGGLWVSRIDPVTGIAAWRSRVLARSSFGEANRNEPLAVVGGRIWMDKMSFDPVTGRSIDEVLVANGTIARDGTPIPADKRKSRGNTGVPLDDPRTALATTSGYNSWHGYPGKPFAGFSGSLHPLMHPGCRTNHRGGSVGFWASDTRGHYRLGGGSWGRKGNDGSVGGTLSAWAADDPAAGDDQRTKPLWKTTAGTGAGMAIDDERIAIVTSGSGKYDAFIVGELQKPRIGFYQRSDGTKSGTIDLPAQVVWRGIAAADGQLAIAFEDGSVGLIR
ncbi:MAG: hypothetical protein RLZZ127_2183, partial [Planctomycetota bacterium]